MDRLIGEDQPNGSRIEYGYNLAGNILERRVIAAGETPTVSYSYDALNRLQTLIDNQSQTTRYEYNKFGSLETVVYPNGVSQNYQYDSLNRLQTLTTLSADASVIAKLDYELDNTGRRTAILESSGRESYYDYDELYRLTSESIVDPANGNYSAAYQYDPVGNRTDSVIDGVSTAFQYDDNDRITSHGTVSYSYDPNGNTLSQNDDGQITTYGYNQRNQLISMTAVGIPTDYQYNPDGIRSGKSDPTQSIDFVVDANRDYAQVVLELVDDEPYKHYVYGLDLVSQQKVDDFRFYLYDGLGTTRALSDQNGNITDQYQYESCCSGQQNQTH